MLWRFSNSFNLTFFWLQISVVFLIIFRENLIFLRLKNVWFYILVLLTDFIYNNRSAVIYTVDRRFICIHFAVITYLFKVINRSKNKFIVFSQVIFGEIVKFFHIFCHLQQKNGFKDWSKTTSDRWKKIKSWNSGYFK